MIKCCSLLIKEDIGKLLWKHPLPSRSKVKKGLCLPAGSQTFQADLAVSHFVARLTRWNLNAFSLKRQELAPASQLWASESPPVTPYWVTPWLALACEGLPGTAVTDLLVLCFFVCFVLLCLYQDTVETYRISFNKLKSYQANYLGITWEIVDISIQYNNPETYKRERLNTSLFK